MTLASTQYDAPYFYNNGTGKEVRNANRNYSGWTSYRDGIRNSINIVAVKTLTDITPEVGAAYVQNFGITTLQTQLDENGNTDISQSMALGGLTKGVKNVELTAAFATIANGGVYTKPVFYTRILDHDGNVLIDNTVSYTKTVLKDSTAWLLTSAMQDVVRAGTGTRAAFSGMTIAGKTGTTTDYNDVWFVGYTPYYTAGVWAGYDNNHSLSSADNERRYHLNIWREVMSRIHENLENKSFAMPDNITSATVCAASGKLPIPGICDGMMKTEYFAEGTTPTEYCDVHVTGEACVESGALATDMCPTHEFRIITLIPEDNSVSGSPPGGEALQPASRKCNRSGHQPGNRGSLRPDQCGRGRDGGRADRSPGADRYGPISDVPSMEGGVRVPGRRARCTPMLRIEWIVKRELPERRHPGVPSLRSGKYDQPAGKTIYKKL